MLELYGVPRPRVPRKEATLMLEHLDQAGLSQPLILGMMGQIVELMNKEGVLNQPIAGQCRWGKIITLLEIFPLERIFGFLLILV